MYKIQLTCFDHPHNKRPYFDVVDKRFERKCEAYTPLLECVIDEAQELNTPDANCETVTKMFVIVRNYKHEGKQYPAAIVMLDVANGIKKQPVTLYDIVWINETNLAPWNQKLRDEFGENITFGLYAEMVDEGYKDDEGNVVEPPEYKYYYRGLVTGKSRLYDTIEKAYEEAVWFMDHIELFVDED